MSGLFMKTKSILFIAVLFLFMACRTAAIDAVVQQNSAISEVPKIAFITYEVSKEVDHKITINLIDVTMAEGNLKPQNDRATSVKGNYEFIQLDQSDNQLDVRIMDNPLIQSVEYVNELGQMERKMMTFTKKEAFIRVQLHPQTKYILLQEIGNETLNFNKTQL